ncbi:hypothetical protein FRC17_010460, partial [Serendipita sp. 399]
MEYNQSQQGHHNNEHNTAPNQSIPQTVDYAQGDWIQRPQQVNADPSAFSPNSWQAQEELDRLLAERVWTPPTTVVNFGSPSARVLSTRAHSSRPRPLPFQPGAPYPTPRRWEQPHSGGPGPERFIRERVARQVYNPNTVPSSSYTLVNQPSSHTAPVAAAHPHSNSLSLYPVSYYATTTEPLSLSSSHMTALPQQLPSPIPPRPPHIVQNDTMDSACLPSTTATFPNIYPIHVVVPRDEERVLSQPSQLQTHESSSTAASSPSSSSSPSTSRPATRNSSLDTLIDKFFPPESPDAEMYRSKLRRVMTSSWLRDNEVEPDPEILLDFMEKSGKKWLCRFYVNGERCQASSSEREVQALEH